MEEHVPSDWLTASAACGSEKFYCSINRV